VVIEYRSSSPMSKPNRGVASTGEIIGQQSHILQPETSSTADKKDFTQYGKMIFIEEYSLTVILHNRTFVEARRDRNGSRAARMFKLRR
jgi:hypothetical protein